MDNRVIDVLDKFSSVLSNLNSRIGEIEKQHPGRISGGEEYCNRLISSIQQTIVSIERDLNQPK